MKQTGVRDTESELLWKFAELGRRTWEGSQGSSPNRVRNVDGHSRIKNTDQR